jgi:hypothetical protein
MNAQLLGLLNSAVCPMAKNGCDGTQYPEYDSRGNVVGVQCQWCDERKTAIAALAAPKEAGDGWLENAWHAICNAADEVDPDWMMHGPEGADAIVALIRRLAAPSKEAGAEFVLVPREPTDAMIEAAEMREDDEPLSDWGKLVSAPHAEIYKAMIAAANPPGDQRQEGESRFFIDHGLVHDRKTGRHLRGTGEYGDSTAEELLAVLHELEQAPYKPLKLHFTREAIRKAIKADPDDAECEAASPPPEAETFKSAPVSFKCEGVAAVGEYQERVGRWMDACFPRALYGDMTQRCDRFLEESLELLQAMGYDRGRVATLVEYVWGRPVGHAPQEVGGTVVTLAALCWVAGMDMQGEADRELARIERPEIMAKIQAKQQAKNALHFDSPLPGTAALAAWDGGA